MNTVDKVRLSSVTIWTILTKMSFLTTCVANLLLDVAAYVNLASKVFLFHESSLSLQKTFVELDIRFASENRCHRIWKGLT